MIVADFDFPVIRTPVAMPTDTRCEVKNRWSEQPARGGPKYSRFGL